MLHQGLRKQGIVVKIDHLVEDREIARFAQIGGRSGDEPERIVVEAGADIRVAALGQRLILMIRAAVGELGCGNVEDALPRAFRN